MFCEKCGTELEKDALFCTKCGTKVGGGNIESNANVNSNDNEIKLTVKPTFKFAYMMIPTTLLWLFFMLMIALPITIGEPEVGGIAWGLGVIVLLVILGIIAIFTKAQYKNLTYDFYGSKVIFVDSFFNLSRKEVKYKHIREVTMKESFIQRLFNLGSIVLYTNAETGVGNGISIVNVENAKEVYAKIKNLINN